MDTLLHIANLFLLVSFSVRSMIWLRSLNLVAGSFFIAWAILRPEPIWASAAWNVLFGAVNIWNIWLSILERRPPKLSEEEQRLHHDVFSALSPREFRKLLDVGQWENGLPPSFLVASGTISERVWMVAAGSIEVRRNEQCIRTIERGDFVGETTFLSKQPMSADIVITVPVRFLSWSSAALEDFMTDQPEIGAAMQKAFGACLVRKLNAAA